MLSNRAFTLRTTAQNVSARFPQKSPSNILAKPAAFVPAQILPSCGLTSVRCSMILQWFIRAVLAMPNKPALPSCNRSPTESTRNMWLRKASTAIHSNVWAATDCGLLHVDTKALLKALSQRAKLNYDNVRNAFQLEIEKMSAYTIVSQLRDYIPAEKWMGGLRISLR